MYRFILLFIIHFSLFTTKGQDVSFYKEIITMKIEKDYFYVSGSYYLKTVRDRSVALVYPFPVDSLMGEVDSILVFDMTENKPIELINKRAEGIAFKADFGDKNELVILISYRQKLLGGRAEYILESAKGWKKPFEEADYQLIIPDSLKVVSFSIPPDESVISDKEIIYYWSKTNYMPSKNIVFEFIEE